MIYPYHVCMMSNLDKISLYGMASLHGQKGKSRKKLQQELSVRLHPKKHARRRTSGASARHRQRPVSPGYADTKGPNTGSYPDLRVASTRVSQGATERVTILRKAQIGELGFKSPDDSCGRLSRHDEAKIGARDI